RVHHAAAGALPRPLDLSLGLASRSQDPPLQSPQSEMVWRLRPRERALRRAHRAFAEQHPALHLRFAQRAFEDARPLHDARGAGQELAAHMGGVPVWCLFLAPPWNFVKAYVFQRGFMDGLEGLIICYMSAFYTFLKYSKARNMSSWSA